MAWSRKKGFAGVSPGFFPFSSLLLLVCHVSVFKEKPLMIYDHLAGMKYCSIKFTQQPEQNLERMERHQKTAFDVWWPISLELGRLLQFHLG